MDRTERRLAVRARLEELKLEKGRAERAAPSCEFCIYGPEAPGGKGICGHIAYVPARHDPVSGEWMGKSLVSTMTARSEKGLCGPEGFLFERIPLLTWARRLVRRHL